MACFSILNYTLLFSCFNSSYDCSGILAWSRDVPQRKKVLFSHPWGNKLKMRRPALPCFLLGKKNMVVLYFLFFFFFLFPSRRTSHFPILCTLVLMGQLAQMTRYHNAAKFNPIYFTTKLKSSQCVLDVVESPPVHSCVLIFF